MSIDTIYNFDSASPTQISDEEYSDVGASAFQLGTAARGFKGSTDVSIDNSGYQEIENTGSLGAFVGSTVPAIATQSDYELDVTVDTTLYQLDDISINVADDWDDICAAIQTSIQTATSSTEECEIVGDNIRVTSKTYGSGSSIVIAAGTAGTGSGDLLAVIDALGATYNTNILTAIDGATLTEDVDYEIGGLDQKATLQSAYNVYTRITMLDSDYQTGYIYITYKTVVSMPDAEYFNIIYDLATQVGGISGEIKPFASSSVPTGWLECDGSAINRTTYSNLFTAIGDAWGEGDGSTTFNIPDLRGRFLRGYDNGAGTDPDAATRTAIATGGATGDNVGSVQGDQMQGHKHSLSTAGTAGTIATSAGFSAYGIINNTDVPVADGINGTPRTGTETRSLNASIMYIIKT